MSLDRENELLIRKALADIVGSVPEAGYVIPAARYCNGLEDFWASADLDEKNTRDEIDGALIAATWLYPLSFTDDFTAGICKEKPLVRMVYEIYMFRQYGLMRQDETETPDVFSKKVLVQHNDFVAGWLGVKEAFQREANLGALDDSEYAEQKTTPVVQIEPIGNQVICEFIPGVIGFAVRLQESLKIRLA